MRKQVRLALSLMLLLGTLLGGLGACGSDHPYDNRRTPIYDRGGEGPGTKR